jgi:hypothetical protein
MTAMRAKYPEIKNLDVKTAKFFIDFYDRYLALSGMNKKPLFVAEENQQK